MATRHRPDGGKPRLLLIDDHRPLLDKVSAMLAADFDVAGLATDGRQAIDIANRIDPDLIVLDVQMPVLDGFRTMHELERAGSRAPVVFLSAAVDDDQASEAFRRGGRGYVSKLRIARDLSTALDQVLHGRLFAPSLTSLFELTAGGGHHVMQRHRGMEPFLDGLARFFDRALCRGDATCVIGTEDVRVGVERRLRDAGWNVSANPRYLVIDVADALKRVLRNGLPDPDVVAEIASELDGYRRAVSAGPTGTLTVFGNMVVPLITGGNATAAVALEREWNRATHDLPFVTLCGYSSSCFDGHTPDAWSKACDEHGVVSHTADT